MAEQTQLNVIPGHSRRRGWRELNSWDAVLLLAVVVLTAAFCWRASDVMRHDWDWTAVWSYVVSRDASGAWQPGMLLKGFFGTLRLGFWALLVALVSGALVGALSAGQRGFASWPATLYITALRNTPPLVLLFLVYFFAGSFFTEPFLEIEDAVATLPTWGQSFVAVFFAPSGQMDRMAAAVLTLGLYSGAYVAEIIRGGIMSIDKGQFEAGRSLGLGYAQTMIYIILPQAFKNVLPSLGNEFIVLLKETSVSGYIALQDLTKGGDIIRSQTYTAFLPLIAVAGIYLAVVMLFSWLLGKLERRLKNNE